MIRLTPSRSTSFLSKLPLAPLRRSILPARSLVASFSTTPRLFGPNDVPRPSFVTQADLDRKAKLRQLFLLTVPDPNAEDSHGPDGETKASRNSFRTLKIGCVTMVFILMGIYWPAYTPTLDEGEYQSFPVEWVEILDADEANGLASGEMKEGGNYKVITVRMPDEHPKVKGNVETNIPGLWHVMIKDPELQIERPYTIFSPPEHIDGLSTQLSFLVKKEPQGEVSKFLHKTKRFDWIEIRGPYPTQCEVVRPKVIEQDEEFEDLKGWGLEDWDRVVMISGGTGISPFVQLLHTLSPPLPLYDPRPNAPAPPPRPDLPPVTIIHASPTLPLSWLTSYLPDPTILPSKLELVDLSPSRITPEALGNILLPPSSSSSSTKAVGGSISHALSSLVPSSLFSSSSSSSTASSDSTIATTPSSSASPLSSPSSSPSSSVADPGRPTPITPGLKTLILLSGPEGFIASLGGPKGDTSRIGGILGDQLGLKAEDGIELRRLWNTPAFRGPPGWKAPPGVDLEEVAKKQSRELQEKRRRKLEADKASA